MGVERAVTRWYLQRQIILDEIDVLQAKLHDNQFKNSEAAEGADSVVVSAMGTAVEQLADEYMQQIVEVKDRLRTLGACPRPMMG